MAKSNKDATKQKNTPPPDPGKTDQGKKRIEVPPLIDMTITFSRSAFLLVGVLVALISFGAGCNLQTIFVRTMVAMIVTGLVMWLISWWVTQQYMQSLMEDLTPKKESREDNLLKDAQA